MRLKNTTKNVILIVAVLLLLTTVSFAQTKHETLSLKINTKQTYKNSNVTVKFLDVAEDSRCPPNVDCIWAGNAKLKFELSYRGKHKKLVEINTSSRDQPLIYKGYSILIDELNFLDPQKNQTKTDYTVVLKIEKK